MRPRVARLSIPIDRRLKPSLHLGDQLRRLNRGRMGTGAEESRNDVVEIGLRNLQDQPVGSVS